MKFMLLLPLQGDGRFHPPPRGPPPPDHRPAAPGAPPGPPGGE